MLTGVLFDWDGTLCDTLPVCVEAFRRTMITYLGKNLSDEEIMEHFGVNELGIIMIKLKNQPENWQAALDEYNAHYRELHLKLREPYPGIRELLSSLRKRGVKVGLVTGKASGSCAISLEMTGLENAFDFIRTGSEKGVNKKESCEAFLKEFSLEPGDVYYVGDAPSDVREAKAAGLHSVSVFWSSIVDREKVLAESPEKTFETVEELKKFFNELT
ncbi:HAD-IA family hydrolase [bacterium]|nr:HAD-IA family hydrolase [bacterium]